MHQARVKENHGASRALGADDAAFFAARTLHQLADQVVVDRPQRVTGGGQIVFGIHHALFVAAGNEHQRAIEFVHIVQKNGDVHGALCGHHVVIEPSAVVLVPLPYVTLKGHLAIDLELVHVQLFAEQVFDRLDHARVARQPGERLAVHMRGKVGAHRLFAFFTDVVVFAALVQGGHRFNQLAGFCRREMAGEKQVAVAVELGLLLGGEVHEVAPCGRFELG